MSEYDLSKLEELLTSYIVEMEDEKRYTLAHNVREIKKEIEERIKQIKN